MTEDLPQGWSRVPLGIVAKPSSEKVEPTDAGDCAYLSLEHIESQTTQILGTGRSSEVTSTKSVFRAGDVLYGRLRPYLNKVCIPSFGGICSTDILVFPQSAAIEGGYLLGFLRQREVVEYANHNSSGVQLPRVSFEALKELEIPLPPLAEQRRIVAKVEALLAEVNAARDRLAKVPLILKRFRQSVLAAAFCGRLTEDWRGGRPARRSALDAYRELIMDEKFIMPEDVEPDHLPSSWAYVPIGNVSGFQQGMQIAKATRFKNGGPDRLPILRIGNYSNGFSEDVEFARVEADTLIADADDIILTRTGETRGKVLTGYRGVFHNNTFRLNYDKRLLVRGYLLYWLQSKSIRDYMNERSGKSAQPDLTHKAFGPCPLPLAPQDEQEEVARRIGLLFALADRIEAQTINAQTRVDLLPSALLAKAFSGELVPTEAEVARVEGRDYEPASVLLERIKAEQATQANGSTPPRAHRPRNGTNGKNETVALDVAPDYEPVKAQTNGNGHTAIPRKPIDQFDTDEVMAAFRQACWGLGDARIDRDELLRRAAQKLGFSKLGNNIREALKGHLRAAIRRKIVGVDGQLVYSMTPTAGSLDTDALLETLSSVTQRNREHERDEVIRAAAKHLGFSQVTDAFREQMKSALNAAVRRGLLERRGAEVVVRVR